MVQNTTINGVVNINKQPGLTSHDVVAQVRKLLATNYALQTKVGHTGTLDPFATGVLLVVVGPATRLIQFTHIWDKTYKATFTLGATSDTDDVTGTIIKYHSPKAKQISKTQIQKTLKHFVGPIKQKPPAYSAVKVKGKKLYEYARAGMPAEALAKAGETIVRSVIIHEIEILQYNYPELTLRIRCSTGTYIRSIARDVGEALGTGAYVSSLCRTRIGQFDSKDSVSLSKLSTGFQQYIHSPASLVTHLSRLTLTSHNIDELQQGKSIELHRSTPSLPPGPAALFDEYATIVGIGIYDPTTSLLHPKINL